jgi:hypothetical protein
MYAFVDLRVLARKGKLPENSDSFSITPRCRFGPSTELAASLENNAEWKGCRRLPVLLSFLFPSAFRHHGSQHQSVLEEIGEAVYSELVVFAKIPRQIPNSLLELVSMNNARRRTITHRRLAFEKV